MTVLPRKTGEIISLSIVKELKSSDHDFESYYEYQISLFLNLFRNKCLPAGSQPGWGGFIRSPNVHVYTQNKIQYPKYHLPATSIHLKPVLSILFVPDFVISPLQITFFPLIASIPDRKDLDLPA